MKSESKFDPKIMEDLIKFGKNIMDAPKLVSAPDEISLEVTPHDIVQEIDKTRLLHYRSLTEKQYKMIEEFAKRNGMLNASQALEKILNS